MNLLVIRHAIAEDPEAFARTGRPDDERPLTDEGRKKMRQAARGLRTVVPEIDLLASSPLVRARETAAIVSDAYDGLAVSTTPALEPGRPPEEMAAWLAGRRPAGTVAVVGHEPALSTMVSWFLTGAAHPVLELKKGAACLLEFAGKASPAGALLRWALAPAQLRGLGD